MKVPLLDLKAQYETIKDEIREAVNEVLESQQFILGPKVEALEMAIAQYCGCAHAVGVSSGTDALVVALMSVGSEPGYGVITTPFTFFATAGSIARIGARPFFVDIDPVTYNVSAQALQAFIDAQCRFDSSTGRLVHRQAKVGIRAMIPVHLYGQCADMDPILTLARRYGMTVIEDAAQAIGADYPSAEARAVRRAGSMGDFGCLSFFPSKNLGGFGDGGMVTTSESALAERLRILRVHGSRPKYYHHLVGGNFRLDALQAAVLLVKFKHLDDWTAGRRRNAADYDSLFRQSGLIGKGLASLPKAVWENGLSEPPANPQDAVGRSRSHGHIYNQYVVRVDRRDELRAYLREHGIGTEIYYPLPLHRQECFAGLGYRKGDFPESEKAAAETLALPVYPELERRHLEYVVDKMSEFYRRV
jgi:dTDP-4-amino-4,6-dideoxygalactose transaminase